MYRFTRSALVKNAAGMPAAIQLANRICAHVNELNGMKMKVGVEMFGSTRIHWSYEVCSLEEVAQLNAKLMQDHLYWEMLEQTKALWADGSMRDTITKMID